MSASGRSSVCVPALGMLQREPADKPRNVVVSFGPQYEMRMVGHYHVTENPHGMFGYSFFDYGFKGLIVGVREKDLHSGVGAVQDVINHVARSISFSPPHAERLTNQGIPVN